MQTHNDLDDLRHLQQILLEAYEGAPTRRTSPALVPAPGTSGASAASTRPPAAGSPTAARPPVRDVLSSLSVLGAALQRLGEDPASRGPSWEAMSVLQEVVEQWLAGARTAASPGAPVPASAEAHLDRARESLRRLGRRLDAGSGAPPPPASDPLRTRPQGP